jgi:transposase-like protein
MTEQKRVYKPEEKLKIVMEGLSGTIQLSDLYRKYNIKSARFYYWKDQLMNSSKEIFEDRGRKPETDSRIREKDQEISRLKDVIAEITSENLQLKKKTGNYGSGRVRT